jgi:hypothetical protein
LLLFHGTSSSGLCCNASDPDVDALRMTHRRVVPRHLRRRAGRRSLRAAEMVSDRITRTKPANVGQDAPIPSSMKDLFRRGRRSARLTSRLRQPHVGLVWTKPGATLE